MNIYLAGQAVAWRKANYTTTILDYVTANPGKTEQEIATGTTIPIDAVMWGINELYKQGKLALVPINFTEYANHPSNHKRG